ncbi:MAG: hypothetical protein ACJ8EW_04115 [Rhizobium sp.]|uniref:hypothetical protein n=1 Tax=Rhizobium sp. TaxID=391 RepID=UPI00389AD0E2
MIEMKHTALPWKVVSEPHFDNGNVYTSIQPVNVDAEGMKPLAMMNGEFHVCRMSHSDAPWRFNYHRANAEFIALACNSHYRLFDALKSIEEEIFAKGAPLGCETYFKIRELALLRNGDTNG